MRSKSQALIHKTYLYYNKSSIMRVKVQLFYEIDWVYHTTCNNCGP